MANYYELRRQGSLQIESMIKGVKKYPIDAIILRIEITTGLGAKFVRERLDRMAKMNHITIDRIKDCVTWESDKD